MTIKPVCAAAVALVKSFEGLRLTAYLCPAGVPTIGYGHTGGVKMGQTITADQADAFLAADLAAAAADIDRLAPVTLTTNQRGALASFQYNTGAFAGSTMRTKLLAEDYAGAADEFGKWVKATVNGQKVALNGLVKRRAAERALFLSA